VRLRSLLAVCLLGLLCIAQSLACGKGPLEPSSAIEDASLPTADARTCGLYRDAGGRLARICCGAATEIPGVSCVDLTVDGGRYGIYGQCIAAGESFEGKVAPALCCDGLVFRQPLVPTTSVFTSYPSGCGPDLAYNPSEQICLACGNGVCEPPENACDCPEDCAAPPDGGKM
jgi:hypothetical protein